MSNRAGSNMTILDTVVGNIMKFLTPARFEITGDGESNNFVLNHAHNTLAPITSVFDMEGNKMSPEIIALNNAEISVNYKFPLGVEVKNIVVVI